MPHKLGNVLYRAEHTSFCPVEFWRTGRKSLPTILLLTDGTLYTYPYRVPFGENNGQTVAWDGMASQILFSLPGAGTARVSRPDWLGSRGHAGRGKGRRHVRGDIRRPIGGRASGGRCPGRGRCGWQEQAGRCVVRWGCAGSPGVTDGFGDCRDKCIEPAIGSGTMRCNIVVQVN